MKAIAVETYYDKNLHRTVGAGEEIEVTEKRYGELSSVNNDAKKAVVKKKTDPSDTEKKTK